MVYETTSTTKTALPLNSAVAAALRAVAGRLRRYALIEGVARVVGFLVLAASIQLAFDYGARGLRWSMRASLLGLIVVGAVWFVWRRIVAPLRRRISLADVANLVERRFPTLGSSLISAVRFSEGQVGPVESNSPELVAAVIAQADRRAAGVSFDAVLEPRRARRCGFGLVAALALVVGMTAMAPEMMALWFQRNVLLQNVDWPKRTHLVVELDGDELIGARGDDLVIQAYAQGDQPREVEFVYETESGLRGRETMVTVGSRDAYRYRYTFKNAQEDFTFYLEGGDDVTEPVRARLLERPRVAASELTLTPPDYTRRPVERLGDGQRAAQVIPGTVVTLSVSTNKPVVSATLMAGDDEVTIAARDADRWVATFSPIETHTYHFAIVDDVGLENRRPVRFSVRVVPDEPPRTHMKLVGAGEMITPEAILPIEVEYTDGYGLATAELVHRVSREGALEGLIPIPSFTAHATSFSTSVNWAVAEVAAAAGESLTLLSRASDFNAVTGPGRAESPQTVLRVVTREELLAELGRREQEYRMDFERLIDSQEQVRRGLLTALGRFGSESDAEQLAADLAPMERRQRNIAGSVNVIRQQFEQILAELTVNQLDTQEERVRLDDGIIQPLTRLAKREQILAADTIRQWSREASNEIGSLVDPQQVAILSQMRAVRDHMIEWEGYQEVINMLRDLIRLQRELHTETKDAVQNQASEVFDD